MPKCIVSGCPNHTARKDKNISNGIMLHGFPKDLLRIKCWLSHINQNFGDIESFARKILEGKKTNSFRICSEHFSPDSYRQTKRKTVLKDDAIPRHFHKRPPSSREQSDRGNTISISQLIKLEASAPKSAVRKDVSTCSDNTMDARNKAKPIYGLQHRDVQESPQAQQFSSEPPPLLKMTSMDNSNILKTDRMLSLTLEILFLLTGEDYKVTKKTCADRMTSISGPIESGRRSAAKETNPMTSTDFVSHEKNKKILLLTNQIIHLLTGEVPARCEDVAVYFSIEEWDYVDKHKHLYKNVIMDDHQQNLYKKVIMDDHQQNQYKKVIMDDPQQNQYKKVILDDHKQNQYKKVIMDDHKQNQYKKVIMDDHKQNQYKKVILDDHKKNQYKKVIMDDHKQNQYKKVILDDHKKNQYKKVILDDHQQNQYKKVILDDHQQNLYKNVIMDDHKQNQYKKVIMDDHKKNQYKKVILDDHKQNLYKKVIMDDHQQNLYKKVILDDHQQNQYKKFIMDDHQQNQYKKVIMDDHQQNQYKKVIMDDHKQNLYKNVIMDDHQQNLYKKVIMDDHQQNQYKKVILDDHQQKLYKKVIMDDHKQNQYKKVIMDDHQQNLYKKVIMDDHKQNQYKKVIMDDHQLSSQGEQPVLTPKSPKREDLIKEPSNDLNITAITMTGGDYISIDLTKDEPLSVDSMDGDDCFSTAQEPWSSECGDERVSSPEHEIEIEIEDDFIEEPLNDFYTTTINSPTSGNYVSSDLGNLEPISADRMHREDSAAQKPLSCSECGKCFRYPSRLIEHKRVHTGEKPFSCPECGKCFIWKSLLIQHQKIHTGEHQCLFCRKCFINKTKLMDHQRTHTGERPFTCHQCGKSFGLKTSLTKHQRLHMREKLLGCFKQKSNLYRHQQTHMCQQPL
ncbi:zinc finger protein 267-like isoform X1 [Bufo bufo]|uniref:zinc finger protein 267-like isoform X1 n=2 Tax=Bufo bufo TaxID=8384 RepID=UPI001ABDEC31|nr:zinc finger protein 267-like isoform X1 [Bufo bufo]XP_040287103.1 zinc finger protein 267-like isoform X1 [Bufo bufo]XP_040287104.1 zinc finger protein 267-like isoform X1 [Bufo bufo]